MLLIFSYDRNIYTIMEIILGISLLITLILSIMGYVQLNFSGRALKDITDSWDKSPILELTNLGGCPEDATPLLTDEWIGTNRGCNCLNRWSDYIPWENQNRINYGFCSMNMTMGGCTNIEPYEPQPLEIWRNSFLCAKKMNQNYTDFYTTAVKSSKSCKSDYKQCGTLDTFGNILCIPSEQKCPINKIVIQDGRSAPPTDFNYNVLSLGAENYALYFTNEAINGKILVDVKISEGDVCVDSKERNTKFPGESYVLERDYNNYGCSFALKDIQYDNRYAKLDTYYKEKVYFENGLSAIFRVLPKYPLSNLKTDLNIYTRPYIGWKLYSSSSTGEDLESVKDVLSTLNYISTMKLVNMIFFIIVLVFFLFQVYFKWDNIALLNFLETIFVTLSFVNLIVSWISWKHNDFSTDFKDFNEGDDITNAIFSNFGWRLDSARSKDITLFVFSFINVFVYPSYLLYQFKNMWRDGKNLSTDNLTSY